MNVPTNYHRLIFTNHARHRLRERRIPYHWLEKVIENPDQKFLVKEKNWKFIKTIRQRKIHLIASYLENEQKWLIVSVWVRGEEDRPDLIWQILSLPFLICWRMGKAAYRFYQRRFSSRQK